MSFVETITNYQKLSMTVIIKAFLTKVYTQMLSLPFFLFLMTALASIFTMNTLKKSENFKLISLGLITCVLIYYLNDLSLALGLTEEFPLYFSNLGSNY